MDGGTVSWQHLLTGLTKALFNTQLETHEARKDLLEYLLPCATLFSFDTSQLSSNSPSTLPFDLSTLRSVVQYIERSHPYSNCPIRTHATMSSLLNLADELLCLILKHVRPNDIDNFLLSCKRLYGTASNKFVDNHTWLKLFLKTIDSALPWYTTPKLLDLVLDDPCKADYIKAMVVRPWRVEYDMTTLPRHGLTGQTRRSWYPYSSDRMRAFEQCIENTKCIKAVEKDRWIRYIRDGDKTPLFALMFLRLHHLTSLVIAVTDLEDLFMLQTLQQIAKDPHSLSLSRLRHVEIYRQYQSRSLSRAQDVQYLLACAALPCIVSVTGYELYEPLPMDVHEEPSNDEESSGVLCDPKSGQDAFELGSQTSSLQHLKVQGCMIRRDTLGKLIRSARSLRSFTYVHCMRHHCMSPHCLSPHCMRPHCIRYRQEVEDVDPSHAWVREVLSVSASTTLEKLVLDNSLCPLPRLFCGTELDFSNFIHLRTLTIAHSSLVGLNFWAVDNIPTLLPASLETLVIRNFRIESYDWLGQVVDQIAKAKVTSLPRLWELTFEDAYSETAPFFDPSALRAVYAIGANVGIWTTAQFYVPTFPGYWAPLAIRG